MICCNKRHTLLWSVFTSWLFSKNYFVDLFFNNFLTVISRQKPILQIRNMCIKIILWWTGSDNSQSLAKGYRILYAKFFMSKSLYRILIYKYVYILKTIRIRKLVKQTLCFCFLFFAANTHTGQSSLKLVSQLLSLDHCH